MSRKNKPLLENILIESVAAEGNSLAHVDGKVLFVPQVIPGDVVDVQVTHVRSGYMDGYCKRIVKPSPDRLEPFCIHYGSCGGCKWQPLPYSRQLEYKQQQVVDQLRRIGHLDLPELCPIMGSEKTVGYRNKLEFTFSNHRWIESGEDPGQLSGTDWYGLGFHVATFFDKVLDIRDCKLQCEPSNEIRNYIREYAYNEGLTFFDLRNQVGFLRNLVIRTASTGELMITVIFAEDDKAKRTALLSSLMERFPQINSLYYVINTKCNDSFQDLECHLFAGADAIYEKMEDLVFKIGPKSFYQTNSEQAHKLYSVVRKFAFDSYSEDYRPVVYDLYTGTGTIALFLARRCAKVVGIEYVPEAIEDAKDNARRNAIGNSVFYAGDMKDVLNDSFINANGRPDVVVLDPPRAGIHPDVAKVLMDCAPQRIVYVSCNPASQARDLAVFSSAYSIDAVQPVDMFPHTHHVENVALLNRRKSL